MQPEVVFDVAISLNALSGNVSFQTLKLQGTIKKISITMLVESGSTHNFLNLATAKSLGYSITYIPPQSVMVEGGGHLHRDSICLDFAWSIEGTRFTYVVCLLPLGVVNWC